MEHTISSIFPIENQCFHIFSPHTISFISETCCVCTKLNDLLRCYRRDFSGRFCLSLHDSVCAFSSTLPVRSYLASLNTFLYRLNVGIGNFSCYNIAGARVVPHLHGDGIQGQNLGGNWDFNSFHKSSDPCDCCLGWQTRCNRSIDGSYGAKSYASSFNVASVPGKEKESPRIAVATFAEGEPQTACALICDRCDAAIFINGLLGMYFVHFLLRPIKIKLDVDGVKIVAVFPLFGEIRYIDNLVVKFFLKFFPDNVTYHVRSMFRDVDVSVSTTIPSFPADTRASKVNFCMEGKDLLGAGICLNEWRPHNWMFNWPAEGLHLEFPPLASRMMDVFLVSDMITRVKGHSLRAHNLAGLRDWFPRVNTRFAQANVFRQIMEPNPMLANFKLDIPTKISQSAKEEYRDFVSSKAKKILNFEGEAEMSDKEHSHSSSTGSDSDSDTHSLNSEHSIYHTDRSDGGSVKGKRVVVSRSSFSDEDFYSNDEFQGEHDDRNLLSSETESESSEDSVVGEPGEESRSFRRAMQKERSRELIRKKIAERAPTPHVSLDPDQRVGLQLIPFSQTELRNRKNFQTKWEIVKPSIHKSQFSQAAGQLLTMHANNVEKIHTFCEAPLKAANDAIRDFGRWLSEPNPPEILSTKGLNRWVEEEFVQSQKEIHDSLKNLLKTFEGFSKWADETRSELKGIKKSLIDVSGLVSKGLEELEKEVLFLKDLVEKKLKTSKGKGLKAVVEDSEIEELEERIGSLESVAKKIQRDLIKMKSNQSHLESQHEEDFSVLNRHINKLLGKKKEKEDSDAKVYQEKPTKRETTFPAFQEMLDDLPQPQAIELLEGIDEMSLAAGAEYRKLAKAILVMVALKEKLRENKRSFQIQSAKVRKMLNACISNQGEIEGHVVGEIRGTPWGSKKLRKQRSRSDASTESKVMHGTAEMMEAGIVVPQTQKPTEITEMDTEVVLEKIVSDEGLIHDFSRSSLQSSIHAEFKIGSFQWKTSDARWVINANFHFPEALISKSFLKDVVSHFQYFSCEEIEVRINTASNVFEGGHLRCVWDAISCGNRMNLTNGARYMHCPAVTLAAGANTSAVLKVPGITIQNQISNVGLEQGILSMGTIAFFPINSLVAPEGTVGVVEVDVFAKFITPKFKIRRVKGDFDAIAEGNFNEPKEFDYGLTGDLCVDETLVYSGTWSTASVGRLFSLAIHPGIPYIRDNHIFLDPVPCISNLFHYWRGDMILRLYIGVTKVSVGKLHLIATPGCFIISNPSAPQLPDVGGEVYSAAQNFSIIDFTIPFNSIGDWQRVSRHHMFDAAFHGVDINTRVHCSVETQLQTSTGSVSSVDICATLRPGKNFQLSCLTGLLVPSPNLAIPEVLLTEAKSDRFAITRDGYMSVCTNWGYLVSQTLTKNKRYDVKVGPRLMQHKVDQNALTWISSLYVRWRGSLEYKFSLKNYSLTDQKLIKFHFKPEDLHGASFRNYDNHVYPSNAIIKTWDTTKEAEFVVEVPWVNRFKTLLIPKRGYEDVAINPNFYYMGSLGIMQTSGSDAEIVISIRPGPDMRFFDSAPCALGSATTGLMDFTVTYLSKLKKFDDLPVYQKKGLFDDDTITSSSSSNARAECFFSKPQAAVHRKKKSEKRSWFRKIRSMKKKGLLDEHLENVSDEDRQGLSEMREGVQEVFGLDALKNVFKPLEDLKDLNVKGAVQGVNKIVDLNLCEKLAPLENINIESLVDSMNKLGPLVDITLSGAIQVEDMLKDKVGPTIDVMTKLGEVGNLILGYIMQAFQNSYPGFIFSLLKEGKTTLVLILSLVLFFLGLVWWKNLTCVNWVIKFSALMMVVWAPYLGVHVLNLVSWIKTCFAEIFVGAFQRCNRRGKKDECEELYVAGQGEAEVQEKLLEIASDYSFVIKPFLSLSLVLTSLFSLKMIPGKAEIKSWVDSFNDFAVRSRSMVSIIQAIKVISENATNVVQKLMDWVEMKLGRNNLADSMIALDLKWDLSEWVERVNDLSLEENKYACLGSREKVQEIRSLYDKTKEVQAAILKAKKSPPPGLVSIVRDTVKKASDLLDVVHTAKGIGLPRVDPIHICFVGAPGVGKSTIMSEVIRDVCDYMKVPRVDRVYSRSTGDQYWSMYQGNSVVVYDDLGALIGDTTHSDVGELIQVKSNAAFPLNMAELNAKGMHFQSEYVFSTTNMVLLDQNSNVRCAGAFHRRRNILVSVERDTDIPQDPEDPRVGLLFTVLNPSDGTVKTEFTESFLNGETVNQVSRVDYNEFLSFCKLYTSKYMAAQRKLVKRLMESVEETGEREPCDPIRAALNRQMELLIPVANDLGDIREDITQGNAENGTEWTLKDLILLFDSKVTTHWNFLKMMQSSLNFYDDMPSNPLLKPDFEKLTHYHCKCNMTDLHPDCFFRILNLRVLSCENFLFKCGIPTGVILRPTPCNVEKISQSSEVDLFCAICQLCVFGAGKEESFCPGMSIRKMCGFQEFHLNELPTCAKMFSLDAPLCDDMIKTNCFPECYTKVSNIYGGFCVRDHERIYFIGKDDEEIKDPGKKLLCVYASSFVDLDHEINLLTSQLDAFDVQQVKNLFSNCGLYDPDAEYSPRVREYLSEVKEYCDGTQKWIGFLMIWSAGSMNARKTTHTIAQIEKENQDKRKKLEKLQNLRKEWFNSCSPAWRKAMAVGGVLLGLAGIAGSFYGLFSLFGSLGKKSALDIEVEMDAEEEMGGLQSSGDLKTLHLRRQQASRVLKGPRQILGRRAVSEGYEGACEGQKMLIVPKIVAQAEGVLQSGDLKTLYYTKGKRQIVSRKRALVGDPEDAGIMRGPPVRKVDICVKPLREFVSKVDFAKGNKIKGSAQWTEAVKTRNCVFFSDGCNYGHDSVRYISQGWPKDLKNFCVANDLDFNSCLIQKYEKDAMIPFHRDNEQCYDKDMNQILTVNFGDARFKLRELSDPDNTFVMRLRDGDSFLMVDDCQERFEHSVTALSEGRVSFTFRKQKSDVNLRPMWVRNKKPITERVEATKRNSFQGLSEMAEELANSEGDMMVDVDAESNLKTIIDWHDHLVKHGKANYFIGTELCASIDSVTTEEGKTFDLIIFENTVMPVPVDNVPYSVFSNHFVPEIRVENEHHLERISAKHQEIHTLISNQGKIGSADEIELGLKFQDQLKGGSEMFDHDLRNLICGAFANASAELVIKRNLRVVACVRIVGSWILFPAHYLKLIEEGDEILMAWNYSLVNFIYASDRCFFVNRFQDLVLFDCGPRVPAARDIRGHFINNEDLKHYVPVSGVLMQNSFSEKGRMQFVEILNVIDLITTNAEIPSITYPVVGGEHMIVSGLKYPLYTGPDLCGGLICRSDSRSPRKIMGIHVAGAKTRMIGYAEIVTVEALNCIIEREKPASRIDGDAYGEAEYYFFDKKREVQLLREPKVVVRGAIREEMQPKLIEHSEIIPSPINGLFGPIQSERSVLSIFDSRLDNRPDGKKLRGLVDPLIDAVDKYAEKTIPFDISAVERVEKNLSLKLKNMHNSLKRKSVLSFEESVNGIDRTDGWLGLNMASSPGFPYVLSRPKGERGKRYLFKEVGTYPSGRLHYEVEDKQVELITGEREMLAKQGKRYPTLMMECLKDERRKLKKIYDQVATRSFSCLPIDLNLLIRKYFLDFAVMVMEKRNELFCKVGINPDSAEWTDLFLALKKRGGFGFAGDYAKFDGIGPPEIYTSITNIVNQWYDDGPENALVRHVLISEICHHYSLLREGIVMIDQGMPSGFPMTVIYNSFCNYYFLSMAWFDIIEDSPLYEWAGNFDSCVTCATYGDDNVVAVDREFLDYFNLRTVAKWLKKFGVSYTDDQKRPIEESEAFVDLDTTTFLKRSFKKVEFSGLMYSAPLDKVSIEEQCHWIRECEDPFAALEQNIHNAFYEASVHGEEYYEDFTSRVNDALKEICRNPYDIPFSVQQERFWAAHLGSGVKSSDIARMVQRGVLKSELSFAAPNKMNYPNLVTIGDMFKEAKRLNSLNLDMRLVLD